MSYTFQVSVKIRDFCASANCREQTAPADTAGAAAIVVQPSRDN